MKRISVGLAQEVERMIPEIIDVVQSAEAAPIVMRLEAFDGKHHLDGRKSPPAESSSMIDSPFPR